MDMNGASSVNSTNPVAEAAPSQSVSMLESLPIETRLQIFGLLPTEAALALAATNKGTYEWTIDQMYRNDAQKAHDNPIVVPFALQWAVWENQYSVFEKAIKVLERFGLDQKEVTLRGLELNCELSVFLENKERKEEWLYREFSTSLIGSELSRAKLIDLACLRGNADIVKALADLAGGIDQLPPPGYLPHYAFAANREIFDILSDRGASTGKGDRDSALLAVVVRIGQRNGFHGDPLHNKLNQASDPVAVLEYMLSKDYPLEHYSSHFDSHPMVAALRDQSAQAFEMMILHKSILVLRPRGGGNSYTLMSAALEKGNLKAISILLERGSGVEGKAFCDGHDEHPDLRSETALVHQLLDAMPTNAKTGEGKTLAQWAVRSGQFQLLRALAKKGFEKPDRAFHFSKGSSSKLMTFLAGL